METFLGISAGDPCMDKIIWRIAEKNMIRNVMEIISFLLSADFERRNV